MSGDISGQSPGLQGDRQFTGLRQTGRQIQGLPYAEGAVQDGEKVFFFFENGANIEPTYYYYTGSFFKKEPLEISEKWIDFLKTAETRVFLFETPLFGRIFFLLCHKVASEEQL